MSSAGTDKMKEMEETKRTLRSILVSTPLSMNVNTLCKDYKELMGKTLPFEQLGYNTVIDLLHDIPDVLLVNGNSPKSPVTLIVSQKTAHLNEMVLKQKTKSAGIKGRRRLSRFGQSRRAPTAGSQNFKNLRIDPSPFEAKSNNYRGSPTTRSKNVENSTRNRSIESTPCDAKSTNFFSAPTTRNIKNSPTINNKINAPSINNKINAPSINNKINAPSISNKINAPSISNKINSPTVSSCERKESRDIELYAPKLDLTLQKIDSDKKKELHYLRRPHYHSPSTTKVDLNLSGDLLRDQLLQKDQDDFMRQLLLKKDEFNINSRKVLKEQSKSVDVNERAPVDVNDRVPEGVRQRLQDLISNCDGGILCSQLPSEYKQRFNKNLNYEDFGYRCLLHLCLDLESIFHCIKESACDHRLYDARKPVPQVFPDVSVSKPQESDSFDSTVVKLDWTSCSLVIPPDALPLGVEIPKEFADEHTIIGDIIEVVVAEIYDLSKFWIHKDDDRLDSLMDDMQKFYSIHAIKYLIPKSLLELGLYCAVITHNEFHRALIVNNQSKNNYIRVFFIDYGTLGKVLKTEVYFLSERFKELPAQAIRARLADIYPPVENTMWSRGAVFKFRELASMKKLEAKIMKIVPNKNILEVYLLDRKSRDRLPINNILADGTLALFTSKKRSQLLFEDPSCVPKVKFVHLFPAFEEIEYSLVPSVEDMNFFSQTDVSPELFFPQYFRRTIDMDLLDATDRKMSKLFKKREKITKYPGFGKAKPVHCQSDMNKLAYGDVYAEDPGAFKENEETCRLLFDTVPDETRGKEQGNFDGILNKLRSQRLNGSGSWQEDAEEPRWGKLTASALQTLEEFYQIVDTKRLTDRKKSFLDDGITSAKPRETKLTQKYFSGVGDVFKDLSELEKYLSEETESSRPNSNHSPNSSKMLDLEDTSPTNGMISWSASTSMQGKDRLSFLSDANKSDMEPSSILDNPIETNVPYTLPFCNDLINLDCVLDQPPILLPQILGSCNEKKNNQQFKKEPLDLITGGALDSDNSICKLDPKAPEFVLNTATLQPSKHVQEVPLWMDKNVFNKVSEGTDAGTLVPLSVTKRDADVTTDNCSTPVKPKKPPPGFGPLPANPRPPPGMGYTVYQPWSTADVQMGTNNIQGMNPGNLLAQFLPPSSSYQCPPIVVFNFNAPYQPNIGYFTHQFQPSVSHANFNSPNKSQK